MTLRQPFLSVLPFWVLVLVCVARVRAQGDILSQPFLGERKVLMIRVKYPGDAHGLLTDAQAEQRAQVLKETFARNSYGKVSLSIDITPELTMPQERAFYKHTVASVTLARIRADAVALAKQAGFDVERYDREIVYSAQLWNAATGMGTVNFRTAFISGGNAYLDAHELGHTLDWLHANFWDVNAGESPISPNGESRAYGDAFDIMGDQGWGQHPEREFHHFGAWFKSRVGWIPPENILTVTESGTYTLQAYEQPPQESTPVQKFTALRIRRDAERDYWLFWRKEEPLVENGVVICWGYNSNMRPSVLLDMTPGSQPDDWKDVALAVGHTFSDPDVGLEIQVVSLDSNAAQVQVTLNRPPVGHLPVIDVVQPGTGQTVKGDVVYEVTAYDPDEGSGNGSGIARVELELIQVWPPERKELLADTTLSAPPYIWRLNSRELEVSGYFLEVTAVSVTGESNTVWFPHIIDNVGPSIPTTVNGPSEGVPKRFVLRQNYPNPFNPSTTIRFALPQATHVTLKVFDVLGREVATLVDERRPAGRHAVVFDAGGLPSGVYFVRLSAGAFVRTRKAVLVR